MVRVKTVLSSGAPNRQRAATERWSSRPSSQPPGPFLSAFVKTIHWTFDKQAAEQQTVRRTHNISRTR